jgi:hypothetical protein
MTRKLKAIGLALLATAAIAALIVSNASAEEEIEGAQGTLTAAEYPATVDGTEENAAGTNAFTIFGEKIVCNGSTFSSSIAKATTTVTLAPTYNNCSTGGGGHKVTITMNGCDFVIHIEGTTTTIKDNYFNTLDIICPAGKEIEIHKYVNATNELLGVSCLWTIGEQKGLRRGKVTNDTTNKDLLLEKSYKKIVAHQHGACGEGETTEGEYDVSITLKGTNGKGMADALEITD